MTTTAWIVVLTGAFFLILTWIALMDIFRRQFDELYIKALWGGVICLVPFIGVILYLVLGRGMGRFPSATESDQGS